MKNFNKISIHHVWVLAIALCLLVQPQFASAQGIVMLVGDVLPLKNKVVWRNLVKLSDRKEGENLVIGAAHARPALYGGFALRAFQRYGDTAELLPIAENFEEFSVDYQDALNNPELNDRIRNASSVYFVGGAPQRLSRLLFTDTGNATGAATAIRELFQSGGLIVGGIPGPFVLSTSEIDVFEALTTGKIPVDAKLSGLGLLDQEWYFDQHIFSGGRFAAALIAMFQLGMKGAIGVDLDTAAVVFQNTVEVLGNRGVLIIDLSEASYDQSESGAVIQQVKLSYLENGDRFDLDALEATPYARKASGFELEPQLDAKNNPVSDSFVSTRDMFRPGELIRLMAETFDTRTGQSQGYALHHSERSSGFNFRLYTGPDSRGWLATGSGEDRYTLVNIYLDINPILSN